MRQKLRRPAIAVMACLAVAAALATGCTTSPAATAEPVQRTHTVVFDPYGEHGDPAAGLRVTDEVSARCENSLLSPENPLARRCFTNETTVALDPCFVPEEPVLVRAPGDGDAQLTSVDTVALCLADPAQSELTRVYVLHDNGEQPRDSAAFDPHWFLELADGTRCAKIFGVRATVEGRHLSYRCDEGQLYGMLDEAGTVWTIHHRAEGEDELDVAEVRTVWK
ncbi:hypothetical protein [Saccharomonospora piscinae]|uniref:hypothetical protein n=1 Tax=Saccharomonospora piscinae TaxID=687388 RepID=UPI000465CF6F|nr:hypothetical protein [Saccharomonospora piscinae]